jgi:hypothetical protein
MADQVKLPLKTFRFRVKDKTSGTRLDAVAHAVNFVWNHCNGAQRHALKHNQCWSVKGELQASTRGAGKLIGIPAQTVEVCDEYLDRRRGAKKAKLRWRGKRSLGWVAFKNQTITGRSSDSTAAKSGFGSIGKSMDESSLVRSPKTRAGVGIAILWPNANRSP